MKKPHDIATFLLIALTMNTVVNAGWEKNTFPGPLHSKLGYPDAQGMDKCEHVTGIAINPKNPCFIMMTENQGRGIISHDGVGFEPFDMAFSGKLGGAVALGTSTHHPRRAYLLVMPEPVLGPSIPVGQNPFGWWKADDEGATWDHIYAPPVDSYEPTIVNWGKTHILENPTIEV